MADKTGGETRYSFARPETSGVADPMTDSTGFSDQSSSRIHPGAVSFYLSAGPVGIVFIHGYGGSSGDFRLLGDALRRRGYSILGLRVAGHGQTVDDLRRTHVADWRRSVEQAVSELHQRCSTIVLIGASFGGTLALDYALRHAGQVHGLVTINTAIRYRGGWAKRLVMRFLAGVRPYYRKPGLSAADRQRMLEIGSLPAWPISGLIETETFIRRNVQPHLRRFNLPALIIANARDPYVDPASADELRAGLGAGAEVYRLPGETHRPLRQPAAVADLAERIDQFIRTRVV